MKDSFGLGLDLVSDIAKNPAFAPQEIELQRKQMLSSMTVSYDDPEYLAGVVFDRLVYGPHPLRPAGLRHAGVACLDHARRSRHVPQAPGSARTTPSSRGRRRHDRRGLRRRRARVRSLGQGRERGRPEPRTPPAPTRRLVVIDRPGAVQTEIRVGNTALPRKHPDYLALDLAIKILGGEGGNRLHRVLRSDRGLTYGASADLNALKDAGTIVADTDTRSETTGEALRLIVDEMWRLQRERVGERELSDAQAYLTGSFPLTIETPSAIAMQILQRGLLRPRSPGARDLSRAGQRGDGRRHSARGEDLPASRIGCRSCSSAMHRSSSRSWPARVRPVRAHSGQRARFELAGPTAKLGDRFWRPPAAGRPSDASPPSAAPATPQRGCERAYCSRGAREGGIAKLKSIAHHARAVGHHRRSAGQKHTIPTTIRVRVSGRASASTARCRPDCWRRCSTAARYWIRTRAARMCAPGAPPSRCAATSSAMRSALLLALATVASRPGAARTRAWTASAAGTGRRPEARRTADARARSEVRTDSPSDYPAPDCAGQIEERFATTVTWTASRWLSR